MIKFKNLNSSSYLYQLFNIFFGSIFHFKLFLKRISVDLVKPLDQSGIFELHFFI